MLWNCPECGCQNIAPDLVFCPQCFKPRVQEQPAEPSAKAKSSRRSSAASAASGQEDSAPQGQTEGDASNA
jgi:uncharacterized Zn finger protein (UPF0148 family)